MLIWDLQESPESVRDRLIEMVDNVGVPFPIVFAYGPRVLIEALTDYKPGVRPVLGSVTRFDFRLLLRQDRPGVFSTICSGTIRRRPAGCEIRARFRFHGAVVFFFSAGLAWSLILLLFLVPADGYAHVSWWLRPRPAAAEIVFLSCLAVLYAWRRRRREEQALTRLLVEAYGPPIDVTQHLEKSAA